jgi:hypothetical protein
MYVGIDDPRNLFVVKLLILRLLSYCVAAITRESVSSFVSLPKTQETESTLDGKDVTTVTSSATRNTSRCFETQSPSSEQRSSEAIDRIH